MAHVHPTRTEAVPADVGGLLQISRLNRRVGLRLAGEVDLSTVDKLERALVELAASDGDVHLELADLRFIDLAGATALANFAARLGRGRHLLLQDPPLLLRRMIGLLWAEQTVMRMSPP